MTSVFGRGMSWKDVQANKKKNPLIKAVGGQSAAFGAAGIAKAAGPVNLNTYRLASRSVRGWAKKRGISPITATKALGETVREAIDEIDYRKLGHYTKPAAHISPTLKAITERTAKGTRPKRPSRGTPGTWPQSRAGYAVQRFGTNLGSELGYGSEPVLRPKPTNVFNTRR